MKKIAFVGATGMLGQPVAEAFINSGYTLSALARDPLQARKLLGPAAGIKKGDLQDKQVVRDFLAGQDFLYLNLSVKQNSRRDEFQPEREGLDLLVDCAREVGIERIGYLSSLVLYHKTDWWVMEIKRRALEKIKSSGIPYSIFYPSTFMESFGKGAYRQGNYINLAGTSRYKMYLIAGEDYGKQVVKAFEHNSGNNDYIVQGKEGFTADEAARYFVENYTKEKIRIRKMPAGILTFLGRFSNKLNYGANIVDALNHYPETFQAQQTWQELGEPEISFLDYIRGQQ